MGKQGLYQDSEPATYLSILVAYFSLFNKKFQKTFLFLSHNVPPYLLPILTPISHQTSRVSSHQTSQPTSQPTPQPSTNPLTHQPPPQPIA